MAHQIAVIGSSNHRGAECYEWQAPFRNLSDYDIIIANMGSLDDKTLDMIAPQKELGTYLEKMASCRREIAQRLAARGILVVIYEPKRQIGGRSETVSNMDWLPVDLEIHRASIGKRLELSETAQEGFIKGYLTLLNEYWMEIGQLSIKDSSEIVKYFAKQPNVVRIPLLLTSSGMRVAELIILEKDRSPRGSILVVHPPKADRVSQGIDRLIEGLQKLAGGESDAHEPPSNVSEVEVPGEDALAERVEQLSSQIDSLTTEREVLSKELRMLRSFVDLLWEWGDALDQRVRASFKVMGLAPAEIEGRHSKEDFIIVIDGAEVTLVVEVTGVDGQIDVWKTRQLIDWVSRLKDSRKVKGLLVGNHCRKKVLNKDTEAFTGDAVEAANAFGLCLISAEDLFHTLCAFLRKQITGPELAGQLISTNGIWKPKGASYHGSRHRRDRLKAVE